MALTIGIDYTSAIHQSAGIGRYVAEMVKALAHLGSAAHYRLFVAEAGRNFTQPLPGPNFSWHSTPITERWLTRLWHRLRLPLPVEYWTGPVNIFHAPDFFLPPVKSSTKTIVTVHDLSYIREPDTVMPGMADHLNSSVPRSVKRANHVIAVSEATRQDLIELYDTPAEKITTLYHGVTAEFQPSTDETRQAAIRQKYGLEVRPFILSVSTLQPRKNFRRLIQAFAHLDSTYGLVIVGGRGWQYETIFQEVKKQGLIDRVIFPGFVEDADLPWLYNMADLFVYPSLYEGFGLPILEAMACGTPVVASNQSSLPEVVGQAGLLVNPRDVEALATAMQRMLVDRVLRGQLVEAGFKQAKKFTWSDMAGKLLALYQKLCEE